MSDLEIAERMKELAYLKTLPRDQEQNKLCMLKAERLYEESTGAERKRIVQATQAFESVMETQDPVLSASVRKGFMEFLESIEIFLIK